MVGKVCLLIVIRSKNKANHSNEVKVVVSGVIIVYDYTLLSRVTSVVYLASYLFNRN